MPLMIARDRIPAIDGDLLGPGEERPSKVPVLPLLGFGIFPDRDEAAVHMQLPQECSTVELGAVDLRREPEPGKANQGVPGYRRDEVLLSAAGIVLHHPHLRLLEGGEPANLPAADAPAALAERSSSRSCASCRKLECREPATISFAGISRWIRWSRVNSGITDFAYAIRSTRSSSR